jgi:hypothetical protein
MKSARIGPRMRGVIADGLFDPERHRAWMCLLWYARISMNGQSLDEFLLAPFLSLIPDETTHETCQTESGGRFTGALLCLYKTVGINPGKQIALEMNESHLTYKDMRSFAQLLVRRRIALARATPEQRMCCEALRALDKGANKERGAESARALRKIHEEALHVFTRRPDDAEEIYEKICNDIQGQVATRATQNALRTADTGDAAGGRGGAHATKFYDFVEAHALLKKYCYRKVFGGKCDVEKCSFDHGAEGEAEMRKDLGNEGFEQRKKQFETRQKALRDKWKAKSTRTAAR